MTIEKRDPPNLTDQFGQFVCLSDADLEAMSVAERADYENVHLAFSEVATLERKIEVATKHLRDTVADLGNAEAAVASQPKPSRIDLVREALCAVTAGRA